MLFEVFGPDKQGKLCTDYFELVPWEDIPDMAKAGHTFKWEGKPISKSSLLSKYSYAGSIKEIQPDKTQIRILCLETGTVYNKQSEAARDLGIDPAQVSDSIKTGRPRSGYTFKKV